MFETDANGDIPNHVTYKIRQNATMSQTTKMIRDLIWTPAPDPQGMIYYINGFSFIQVSMQVLNLVRIKTTWTLGLLTETSDEPGCSLP